MKAVKINKIIWNLNDLDPAEKAKAKETLPTEKGFIAEDDFDVAGKVPDLLVKKFGYDIINFSYSEIHIVETFENLLKVFTPKGEKPKKLFNNKGELSEFGEGCYRSLLAAIARRKELEKEGTGEEDMPKILDKVMLSLEKITNMDWDETSEEDWKTELENYLQESVNKYMASAAAKKKLRKEAKKSLKDEIKKMDADEEFDEDDFDDDEDDEDEE